jgi:hypothetical protein
VPSLIFRTLVVRAEIPAVQPCGILISYFAGVAVSGLPWWRAARFFGLSGTSAVVPFSGRPSQTRS